MKTQQLSISSTFSWSRWAMLLWPFLGVALLWIGLPTTPQPFVYVVKHLAQLPVLETEWAYAYLHVFAFVPVFLLSFDRKVHYYTSWRMLLPAIAIMGILFIVWDAGKTLMGVWNFNERYITSGRLLYLPWEEWMFFFSVPFASIFIYECINAYFPGDPLAPYDKPITLGIILVCFLMTVLTIHLTYSSTTFLLTGGFLLYHWLYFPNTYRTRFYRAFLVILIPFLLVDGALTGAFTAEPIIVYNPAEFMNLRIVSIPVEDAVYGFLHLFGICYWLEWWREKK